MSGGGFDFSEFEQYRDNFKRMFNEFQEWLYGFLYEQGLRFIAKVKPRTPVDSGDLRNHWALDPNITRMGDVLHCHFVNPMYYASFVEYGHAKPYKSGAGPGSIDWVEGYFMMTVSLEDIQRELPNRFNASFAQYLARMGLI